MPKAPPPELGQDLFNDKKPATSGLLNTGNAAPPPPPAPRPPAAASVSQSVAPAAALPKSTPKEAQPPATLRVVPDAPATTTAVVPEPPAPPEPVSAAEPAMAPAAAIPVAAMTDVERDKMIAAVFAVIASEPELAPEAVLRIASATNRDPEILNALLARIATSPPRAGKQPEPLDVAPRLHKKAKEEVARQRSHGDRATLTTVVLTAIGQAQQDGKLATLVAAFHSGERQRVPLFGNIVVGTAPRGATVKLQFAPDPRARLMVDVLTLWYRVPRANLVRLVLEDRYRRKLKAEPKAELSQPNPNSDAAAPTASESVG